MNDFVEECRREWRRLGVPDPVVNDMAAELAADLDEAQAEGGSPEDVLGSGASDPGSFAASWAAERGVGRSSSSERVPRRALISAAVAALAAVAVSGAVLMIVASTSSSATQRFLAPPSAQAAKDVWVTIAPPPMWVEQDTGDSSADTRTIGLVLLIVGVAGMVPMTAWVAVVWRRSSVAARPTSEWTHLLASSRCGLDCRTLDVAQVRRTFGASFALTTTGIEHRCRTPPFECWRKGVAISAQASANVAWSGYPKRQSYGSSRKGKFLWPTFLTRFCAKR